VNKRIILALLVIAHAIHAGKGFVAGTVVMTATGLKPIEQIKPNEKVISYNFKAKCPIEDKVLDIVKRKTSELVEIETETDTLQVHPQHRFFSKKEGWIQAKDLLEDFDELSSIIRDSKIIRTARIKKDVELYCLSIKDNHNFFVSKDGVLVHNVVPLAILGAWAAVKGTLAAVAAYTAANTTVSVSVSVGGVAIMGVLQNMFHRNRHEDLIHPSIDIRPNNVPTIEYKQRTNKESRKVAEDMGYVEDKQKSRSHGQPVFKHPKKDTWITPDTEGHNGGTWKEMDRKDRRIRTIDDHGKTVNKCESNEQHKRRCVIQ
jgi:pretoxin HINT domain-containing protein/putative RNase toxin 21 of polymorphic toxin system